MEGTRTLVGNQYVHRFRVFKYFAFEPSYSSFPQSIHARKTIWQSEDHVNLIRFNYSKLNEISNSKQGNYMQTES